MERIQFYPDSALLHSLNNDAARLGVAISTLVSDILKRHYGLVPVSTRSESELNAEVFDEVRNYIQTLNKGDVFDLLHASQTYAKIEMTYSGKPSAVRAKIGKAFSKSVGAGDFPGVAVNKINGKIIKSVNNATTYIML